jgi:hypothetical protein
MQSSVGAWVLSACCALTPMAAYAEPPPAASEVQLLSQRAADELIDSLEQEAQRAYTWRVTWTAINGGLTVLAIGGLFVLPRSDRPDLILSTIFSALSTAATWLWAMDVESDAKVAAQLKRLPGPRRLERARELFEHSARDESSRLAWPWHAGNFLSALIPAAIILFAFHKPFESAVSLVTGFALGEFELLTQPTNLLDSHRTVRAGMSIAWSGKNATVMYRFAW